MSVVSAFICINSVWQNNNIMDLVDMLMKTKTFILFAKKRPKGFFFETKARQDKAKMHGDCKMKGFRKGSKKFLGVRPTKN